jgi:hypothetical protein
VHHYAGAGVEGAVGDADEELVWDGWGEGGCGEGGEREDGGGGAAVDVGPGAGSGHGVGFSGA